jgi:predicted DsbA family dithiol-disulfide isomerase
VRIEELEKHFRIAIRWRAFPLHPEIPPEGLTLVELFAGRDIDIPAAMTRLSCVAGELHLPWGNRDRTYNSRLAQEMGKWAEDMGKGNDFHMSVFHAYFAGGKNIAQKETLALLASSIGLREEEALKALESGRYREAVDEDWRLSRKWSITAVPTFMIDGQMVVGAQPYKVLEEFLRKCKIQEKGNG